MRDMLLAKNPKDKDYLADCSYEQLREFLLSEDYEIITENPEFLTLRARKVHQVMDFACPRVDMDYDGRRPGSVKRASGIEEDLARRDFTMNAMAMRVDPKTLTPTGDLIDPCKGVDDIQYKIIRFVGDPRERLTEDGLRWLRALRFAITLNFNISHRTSQALKRADLHTMENVHPDRIREELHKCFAYDTGTSIKVLNEFPCIWLKGGMWLKPTTERPRKP